MVTLTQGGNNTQLKNVNMGLLCPSPHFADTSVTWVLQFSCRFYHLRIDVRSVSPQPPRFSLSYAYSTRATAAVCLSHCRSFPMLSGQGPVTVSLPHPLTPPCGPCGDNSEFLPLFVGVDFLGNILSPKAAETEISDKSSNCHVVALLELILYGQQGRTQGRSKSP